TDADHVLNLAMNAEPHDDAVQRHRNDDGLEHKRDRRGEIKVRGVLHEGLPGDRGGERKRVRCINVEQRIEPVLIKLQEADQHQRSGQKMGDIEIDSAHQKLADTKRSRVARSPSIRAKPKNWGTRNTRILAIDVSNSANRKLPMASLPT